MKILSIDTETCLIKPAQQLPQMVCLSWYDGEAHGLIKSDNEGAYDIIFDMLSSADLIVGQNIAFDLGVLCNMWSDFLPYIFAWYEAEKILSVDINEKLYDIAHGVQGQKYSLQAIAQSRLGIQIEKEDTWRMRYEELIDVPLDEWPQEAVDYAILDAKLPYQIYEHHIGWTTAWGDNFLEDAHRQAAYDFALKLMSAWGIKTDKRVVEFYLDDCAQRLVSYIKILEERDWIYYDEKIGDWKKRTKVLKEWIEKNIPDWPRTKNGTISVTKNTIELSTNPALQAFQKHQSSAKRLADLKTLRDGYVWPIHSYFNSLVATGRTSSRNPNIQNRSREEGDRECFIPRPGNVFLSADYNQLELHTVAQVLLDIVGYSQLANALNNKIDVHLEVASELLGMSYTECKIAISDDKHSNYDRVNDARQLGKVANFGFPGGLGANGFMVFAQSRGMEIQPEEAENIKHAWITKWPEFGDYFSYIKSLGSYQGGYDIIQLYSKRERGNINYTTACNSYFQGLGADCTKYALFQIQKNCYSNPDSPLYGCRVVNYVHDEFILEIPKDDLINKRATELITIMTESANKWLPDVPTRAEPVVMRRWSKNAKLIRDKKGNIMPWEWSHPCLLS